MNSFKLEGDIQFNSVGVCAGQNQETQPPYLQLLDRFSMYVLGNEKKLEI